jgi:hypothetical protein
MKKMLSCVVVLFLLLSVAAFADRAAIDEVTQAFDALATEAETIAQLEIIGIDDFSGLEQAAQAADPKVEAIEDEKQWEIQDGKNLAEINERFNKAMTTVAKTLLRY